MRNAMAICIDGHETIDVICRRYTSTYNILKAKHQTQNKNKIMLRDGDKTR